MNEIDEEITPEAGPPAVPALTEEQPARPRNRLQEALRNGVRWLLGVLIVFGLGALTVLFTLYAPGRSRSAQLQASLDQANDRIQGLEEQVEELSALETKNNELQDALGQANVHITLLRTLVEVHAARLSLANDDLTTARGHLTNTGSALDELDRLTAPGQDELLAGMQDRLALAIKELDSDAFAAQSDLTVLATNLVQLENTLFAGP